MSILRTRPAVSASEATWCGPGGVEIRPSFLQIDGVFAVTLTVSGFPEAVLPGWLEAVTAIPARIDVAVHAEPVAPLAAAARLRKQRARLESGRRRDAERGRLGDPLVEAAAQDAADLAGRIARASAKLFRAAIHITAYADTLEELDDLTGQIRGVLAAQLATVTPATFRQYQGWISTLPLGVDRLGVKRTLETEALAACLPISSPDLPAAPGGVLLGVNTQSGNPVFWDRWSQQNHNSLVLGSSGSGKSFLAKTDLLRELCQGTHATVIDPDGEYAPLATAVGGQVLELGAPGVRINPLDLPDPGILTDGAEALTRIAADVHALVGVLVGDQAARAGRPVLDRALRAAYTHAGITADIRTWTHPAPDLRTVCDQLREDPDAQAGALAGVLDPFVAGSHGALFDAPSSHRRDTHLTVYSLARLPEQLRPAAVLMILSHAWQAADASDGLRRMVLIDEAWLLLKDPVAEAFLFRLAKSARKHALALALVTQDAADLLSSELGTAVAANAATQILLRQSAQTLTPVAEAFGLSAGEAEFLRTAPRGNALLTGANGARTTLLAVGAPGELELLHTGLH